MILLLLEIKNRKSYTLGYLYFYRLPGTHPTITDTVFAISYYTGIFLSYTASVLMLAVSLCLQLSRLSDTGEEYIVLTASTGDRTCGHLGSSKGENFIQTSSLQSVKKQFLDFCAGLCTLVPFVSFILNIKFKKLSH